MFSYPVSDEYKFMCSYKLEARQQEYCYTDEDDIWPLVLVLISVDIMHHSSPSISSLLGACMETIYLKLTIYEWVINSYFWVKIFGCFWTMCIKLTMYKACWLQKFWWCLVSFVANISIISRSLFYNLLPCLEGAT